jgi:hypothetical protein
MFLPVFVEVREDKGGWTEKQEMLSNLVNFVGVPDTRLRGVKSFFFTGGRVWS